MDRKLLKSTKKLCCGLLAAAMVMTSFPQGMYREKENTVYADNTSYEYTVGNTTYTYTVEGDTVTIEDYDCTGTEIVIPDEIDGKSVTSIRAGMFSKGSVEKYIEKIEIPSSMTSIGGSAFENCSSLAEIEIPDGVTSIEGYAFHDCSSLAEIEIPDSVTSIESGTFWDCSSLKEIKIPDGVESIGGSVFYGCSNLEKIEIPGSVTEIGRNVFLNCNNLTIYCNQNSCAQNYAETFNIPFHWRA